MSVNLIYATEKIIGPSPLIFLAGPTPRSSNVKSWRPLAIELFGEAKFKGTLLLPESKNDFTSDYLNQIEWEEEGLTKADCIVFWIPRNMKDMPGLTTNIEWGTWHKSGKVILGIPPGAEHTMYIKYYADKLNIPQAFSLSDIINLTIKLYGSNN